MQVPSVKLYVEPVAEPLVLSDVKNYLKVDNSSDDSLISSLIKTARQMAEEFLRMSLITQSWKMCFDKYCPSEVKLLRGAVQSVASVKIIDKDGSETVVSSDLYYLTAGNQMLKFESSIIGHRVEILYICGYGDSSSDVPEPIRQGIMAHVAQIYDGRTGINSMPTQAVEFYSAYRGVRF